MAAEPDDAEPDDEFVPPDDDVCCICGRPAVELYDERADCPCCGSVACGMRIQLGLDYMDERG